MKRSFINTDINGNPFPTRNAPASGNVLSAVTPARTRAQIEVLEAVNDAAEADMLRGNPVTGAHHRAIEAKLKELRGLLK